MRMICGDEYGFPEDDELEEITGATAWTDIAEYQDISGPGDTSEAQPRKLKLWQSIYTGISIAMLTICIGSGFREIAIQQVQDPNWYRMCFILVIPAQVWLSLLSHVHPLASLNLRTKVLLSGRNREHRTSCWSNRSDKGEQQILLWQSTASAPSRYLRRSPPTCHNSDASL